MVVLAPRRPANEPTSLFSVQGGQFVEFDRETGRWSPVSSYGTIMSASPRAAGPVDTGDGSAAAEAE
jgi:hypothetical protein